MRTKTVHWGETWYCFLHSESSLTSPSFIFPAIWWNTGSVGLQANYLKITFGFFRFRLEVVIGKKLPELSGALDWDSSGFSEFITWAEKWSKKSLPKINVERWLMNTDWEKFIKLGGSKYHYGRIILVRDLMDGKSASIDGDIEVNIKTSSKPK